MTNDAWHASHMRPTPRELIDRLKELEGVETDELLAQKLNLGVRNLARWKAGESAPSYETTIELLTRAGALSWNVDDAELDRQIAGLLGELEEVVQRVLSQIRSTLLRQAPPRSGETP